MKMFTYIVFIIFNLGVFQIAFSQETIRVDFEVKGLTSDTVVLGYHFGKQRLIYDTLILEENRATFETDQKLEKGLYFLYTPKFYMEFVLAEPSLSLSVNSQNILEDYSIENSLENEIFWDFQKNMGTMQQNQRELSSSLKTLSGSDSLQLRSKIADINTRIAAYQDSIMANFSETFFAKFILLMKGQTIPGFDEIDDQKERRSARYRYLKDHYFDGFSIADMMRSPVVHNYVLKYIDELVVPQPDTLISEVDFILAEVDHNPAAFRYWLVTFFNKFQESNIMGMDAVTAHLVEKYYLSDRVDWLSDESKEEMRKELRYIKPNLLGKQAPVLSLLDTAGAPWTLEMVQTDYVILYFYDPDCGVCKKKTPILLDAYEEIQALGAEVVAVCTITDQEKWKSYIMAKNLRWVNVADPYYRSNFRADYNVRSTPQLYILDESRSIIAKKLDVDQVVQFIKEHKKTLK